jgi:hypothetical protein
MGGPFLTGGLNGVSTHDISDNVDETPLVPALKLNRD